MRTNSMTGVYLMLAPSKIGMDWKACEQVAQGFVVCSLHAEASPPFGGGSPHRRLFDILGIPLSD